MRSPQGSFRLAGGVLPDEEVRFTPSGRRRGLAEAVLVEVVHPSNQRIYADCPVAANCGGCTLQFVQPAYQAQIKSDWVKRAFAAHMSSQTTWIPCKPAVLSQSRRRARYWCGVDEKGRFLGFRAPKSHKVIRHAHCMQVAPLIDSIRKTLETSLPDHVKSVEITSLNNGIHVVFESDREFDVLGFVLEINAQFWWRKKERLAPVSSEIQPLYDRLPAGESWIDVEVGPGDFVQGQKAGNISILRQVQKWAEGSGRVADLFSGIGNLSLPLAALGRSVAGAEISPATVKNANRNAMRLGVDASYLVSDLFGRFDPEPFVGADVLILDPPRRGAKNVCGMMNVLLPRSVIMLHCDVEAGSRDASALASYGYQLQALRAIDLFAYTGHVEAMSLWQR